jgi:hypothetical protein
MTHDYREDAPYILCMNCEYFRIDFQYSRAWKSDSSENCSHCKQWIKPGKLFFWCYSGGQTPNWYDRTWANSQAS